MTNTLSPITHIGYVGLGIMGSAMAANLLKAGYKLTVWNRTAAKAQPLVESGAKLAASPAGVAAGKPDVICINVTNTQDVEMVLFGPQGLANSAVAGLIVVDHSTISPVATQQFAKRLEQQRLVFLDAPVSGGDVGAKNATLSIMVGGPVEAFERCLPIFQSMGKSITHLGPSGMGQVCKACNQVAGMINLLGVCEAMALAKRCGLDLEKMIQVVSAGAAGSWQLANLGPKIAKGDMAPGFMIDLVLKDLAIVAETARKEKLPLPATELVEGCFRSVAAGGGGKLGTQAVSKAIEMAGHFRFVE